ncbi:MAG: chloride channel protein [Acidobacteriota bacterium]|jgi:CIC family chloride channel protein
MSENPRREQDQDGEKRYSLWLLTPLAILMGVVAGGGAWAFRLLIGLVHNVLFLGELSFYYDANLHTAPGPWGWGVVLAPVLGALVVAWMVKNYAPEAKGHGVPEVMDAIYYNRGVIRPRVAVIKSLASALSIGSGGAVGREGPIIQIGAAFGSTVGQLLRVPTRERITLIAAGAGAGIAATFNAPLGGVVFAIELLLVTVNARTLLLVASATATGTYVSNLLIGVQPSFNIPRLEAPVFHLLQSGALLLFFPLGALIGLLSVALIHGIYDTEAIFDRIPGNYYTRHALGMLCVGLMMVLLLRSSGHYYVQGVGYATIMDVLEGTLTDPWFLVLLLVLKLAATSLSLGSGASGGVFSPALFIGATGGAAFGHLCLAAFPALQVDVSTFAIAGMAAAIGGSTGALLTGIVMISEMTQDPSVTLPLIIAVAVAYAVRKGIMRESIYTAKLIGRGHAVPEGLQSPFLAARTARDAMVRDLVIQEKGATPPDGAPIVVVEDRGRIVEILQRSQEASSAGSGNDAAPYAATRHFVTVGEQDGLLTVLELLEAAGADVALVSRDPETNAPASIVGLLTRAHIAAVIHQHRELL